MAVSVSNLLASGSNSESANFTTASFTAPLYRLILVAIGTDTLNFRTCTCTGLGITWTQIAAQGDNDGQRIVQLFRGVGNGTSGALTFTWSGAQSNPEWSVNLVTGVKISNSGADAIVQSAGTGTGEAGSTTVTLAAFGGASNGTFGVCMVNGSSSITTGTGFTQLSNDATSTKRMHTQFRSDNDTSVTWSFGSNMASKSIAVELAFGSDLNASPFILNLV